MIKSQLKSKSMFGSVDLRLQTQNELLRFQKLFQEKIGCLVKYCESAFEVSNAENHVWDEAGK
jgi:hypothetical protein